jgi:hypothetical protein
MTPVGPNPQRRLLPGTEVELLTHYQEHWTAGYEIAAVQDDRYMVRRRSDNTVLPTPFAKNQIRPRPR